jgi:hypothetical protein
MCSKTSPFIAAILAAISLVVPVFQIVAAEPVTETTIVYPSPIAVYEVFRASYDRRDWQTIFSCLTPKFRDEQVFEAFVACSMQPSNPRIVAVLKRHGVNSEKIRAEYHRRYKEKYGIDIARLLADRKAVAEEAAQPQKSKEGTPASGKDKGIAVPGKSEELKPPCPPTDEVLLQASVCEAVTNKAAFCCEVDTIIKNGERSAPMGKLEQLTVDGDKAVGLATTVVCHYGAQPDRKSQMVMQEMGIHFCFRKVDGSWLIESKE